MAECDNTACWRTLAIVSTLYHQAISAAAHLAHAG
jgi:hypothetical protein